MSQVSAALFSFLALQAAVACGGRVADEPGPMHEGAGLYDLFIEARSDDCIPPFVVGKIGRVMVATRRGGADGASIGMNIPLYFDSLDSTFPAARSDVSSEQPIIAIAVPGCPSAQHALELTIVSATGLELVVECRTRWSGLRTCPAEVSPPLPADCSSDRIFRFRWIRACDQPSGANCG